MSEPQCYWRSVGRSVSQSVCLSWCRAPASLCSSHNVRVTMRLTVGQSVSLSVLVSSPGWGSWPDVSSCLKVTVLSMWCALSHEMSGLSFVSHSR
jgi:hypothetical protein